MSAVVFTSFFGTIGIADNGWQRRQQLLHQTATEFGKVDREIKWSRSDLVKTGFYAENRAVLDDPRGGGLWAWKPWVILETLKTVANGDFVVYHDIGKPFRNAAMSRGGLQHHGNVIELPIHSITQWAADHDGIFPGVNTPHYGPASQWTKRDCFVGMGCDRKEIWDLPLVQAGYNAWQKTPTVIEFLELWLKNCCDRQLISDDENVLGKPNLPDFSEHRHDQSVLTNLIRREGITAYGSETVATPYVRNFNYLVRRIGLDRVEANNHPTLTALVTENGGSKNLPVSVTSWIDLDLANRQIDKLKILYIRADQNQEEIWLKSFLSGADWDELDLSNPDAEQINQLGTRFSAIKTRYDWVLAYGFKDHALLSYITRISVRLLKPMAYLIAGLDASQHFVNDNTFSNLIQQVGRNRQLTPPINVHDEPTMQLVVGTATNPVLLKRRRGKPIVVSVQAGLPVSYYD